MLECGHFLYFFISRLQEINKYGVMNAIFLKLLVQIIVNMKSLGERYNSEFLQPSVKLR